MPRFAVKASLLATTIIAGVAIAAPAYAQDATNNQAAPNGPQANQEVPGQVSSPTEANSPSSGVQQPLAPSSNRPTIATTNVAIMPFSVASPGMPARIAARIAAEEDVADPPAP